MEVGSGHDLVLTLIFLDGLRKSMKNIKRIGFQVSNTGSWEYEDEV
jgi:hypothetical protein